ncbi:hypothetical protein ABD77_00780 [Brevibacillus formosus]|nr:hypothetical protein [Brevibacillus formosus]
MNCPYCERYGIVAEVIQAKNLSRCAKCLQDMSCPINLSNTDRIFHRQHWGVLEEKEATT